MSEEKKTINIAPSWTSAASMYVMMMQNGTEQGKAEAAAEIRRMGALLDHLIEKAGDA